jgi:predicted dehydrogenase
MGGPVESVFGYAATRTHDIEVEDTAAAVLKFKSGALGLVEATTCTSPRDIEGSITVLGDKGSVKIGGFAANEAELWEFDKPEEEDKTITDKSTIPPNVYGFGHISLYKNIIDSLLDNKKALICGEEGAKSIKLVEAIYKSIDENKEIKL